MMSVAYELLHTLSSNGEAAMLAVVCLAAMLSLVSGMLWARQWYLLVVSLGLIALTGFLANPLADSRSALDLRMMLMGPDVLLVACVLQTLLAAASFTLGLRLVAEPNRERTKLAMSILYCVPQPVFVLSMLLVEQHWLSQQLGARPEWIGILVPGIMLLVILSLIVVGLFLRQLTLALLHFASSATVGVASTLFATTASSLPTGDQAELITHALTGLGPALLLGMVCLAVGMAWERQVIARSLDQIPTGQS